MIQITSSALTSLKSKVEYDRKYRGIPHHNDKDAVSAEHLSFVKRVSLEKLSGDNPIIALTIKIEESGMSEEIKELIRNQSQLLFAEATKNAILDFFKESKFIVTYNGGMNLSDPDFENGVDWAENANKAAILSVSCEIKQKYANSATLRACTLIPTPGCLYQNKESFAYISKKIEERLISPVLSKPAPEFHNKENADEESLIKPIRSDSIKADNKVKESAAISTSNSVVKPLNIKVLEPVQYVDEDEENDRYVCSTIPPSYYSEDTDTDDNNNEAENIQAYIKKIESIKEDYAPLPSDILVKIFDDENPNRNTDKIRFLIQHQAERLVTSLYLCIADMITEQNEKHTVLNNDLKIDLTLGDLNSVFQKLNEKMSFQSADSVTDSSLEHKEKNKVKSDKIAEEKLKKAEKISLEEDKNSEITYETMIDLIEETLQITEKKTVDIKEEHDAQVNSESVDIPDKIEYDKSLRRSDSSDEQAKKIENTKILDKKCDFKEKSDHKKDTEIQESNAIFNFSTADLSQSLMEEIREYDKFSDKESLRISRDKNKELFITIPDTFDNANIIWSREDFDNIYHDAVEYAITVQKTVFMQVLQGRHNLKDFMNDVGNYTKKVNPTIPSEDYTVLLKMIERNLFGYSVLTPLINDDRISDIKVLDPKKINVKIRGVHYTVSNLKFPSENEYASFLISLLLKNHVQNTSSIRVFTDAEFNKDYRLRFNLCMPDINCVDNPYLHIRKTSKKKKNLDYLIQEGMLPVPVALYLQKKAKTAKGIVFSGPSASGKSTLMNALLDEADFKKAILLLQESDELFSDVHPNVMAQHITEQYDLDALGINGLLCDAGYFIIGEIKGKEARSFVRSANTGHMCWCSIHSSSASGSLPRLADYIKYGSDYSFEDALKMLVDMEVLVHIENYKVKEIKEVIGFDSKTKSIIYKQIYKNSALYA